MKYNTDKKKLYSLIFLLISSSHFLILYLNTPHENFELLEALKLYGPIVTLGFIALFGNEGKLVIIKYGYYILAIHICLGFLIGGISGPSALIGEDGRLIIQLLGRGAGETAWALCVLLVTLNYLSEKNHIILSKKIKFAIQIIVLLSIILTQTRSAILFIIVYNIVKSNIKIRLKFFLIIITMSIVIMIIGLSGAIPVLTQMIERSVSIDTLLTGREYIWATQLTALTAQDIYSTFFGTNLTPKIHEITEISYVTADPHNLYIDLVQYYGLIGLIYMVCWYYSVVVRSNNSSSIVVAFAIMSIFVSAFRYPMLFYANIIILLIPTNEIKKYTNYKKRGVPVKI